MDNQLEKTGHFYQKAVKSDNDDILISIIHLMKKPNEDIMELMENTRKSKEFLAWIYPTIKLEESWKLWREKQ